MKRGFVLMETIVVVTVLCVILIALYASYYKLLENVHSKSLYDNTEYIYKTVLVREELEKTISYDLYKNSPYYTYCRNQNGAPKKCYTDGVTGNFENELFKNLKVEAVYITVWDTSSISPESMKGFEPTTQNYIKTMDPTDEGGFRLIVMYRSENNDTDKDVYEYASLMFGSRR